MQHVNSEQNISIENKKSSKRLLAKELIHSIMTLYDIIIQKIEHGIGVIWEQYFSEELFKLAKLRVQNQLISTSVELNGWFDKISLNVRNKVNGLSDSLIGHFNQIIDTQMSKIQQEIAVLKQQKEKIEKQALETVNKQNNIEVQKQINCNAANNSFLQTCAGSIQKELKLKQQTIFCTFCNRQFQILPIEKPIEKSNLSQSLQDNLWIENCHKNLQFQVGEVSQIQGLSQTVSQQSQNRQILKMQNTENDNQQSENQNAIEGGLYGVLLNLLDAFEI